MPSNSEPIVQQLRLDFETLLAYVTGPAAGAQTAYTVELTLFRQLLALGATLLRLFFVTRAAERPAAPVPTPGDPPSPIMIAGRSPTTPSLARFALPAITSLRPDTQAAARWMRP